MIIKVATGRVTAGWIVRGDDLGTIVSLTIHQ
jgi:hypothetical protein